MYGSILRRAQPCNHQGHTLTLEKLEGKRILVGSSPDSVTTGPWVRKHTVHGNTRCKVRIPWGCESAKGNGHVPSVRTSVKADRQSQLLFIVHRPSQWWPDDVEGGEARGDRARNP